MICSETLHCMHGLHLVAVPLYYTWSRCQCRNAKASIYQKLAAIVYRVASCVTNKAKAQRQIVPWKELGETECRQPFAPVMIVPCNPLYFLLSSHMRHTSYPGLLTLQSVHEDQCTVAPRLTRAHHTPTASDPTAPNSLCCDSFPKPCMLPFCILVLTPDRES